MSSQSSNFKIYFWPVIKDYYSIVLRYWPCYGLYLIGLAAQVLLVDILLPWFLKELIDLLATASSQGWIANPNNAALWGDVFSLFYWGALALVSGVLIRVILDVGVTNSQPLALRDLEIQSLKIILRKPYDFFTSNLVGSLTAKVKRYSDSMLAFDFGVTRGLWVIFIQYIAAITVVAYYSAMLALVFVLWSVVFLLVSLPLMRLKGQFDREYGDADSKAVGGLADTLSNYLSVKAFSRQAEEVLRFEMATSRSLAARKRSWYMSTRLNFVQGGVIVAFQIILLALSLKALQSQQISMGTLLLVQAYLLKVGSNLTELGTHFKEMFRALASASDMYAVLQDPQREYEPENPKPLTSNSGNVEFRGVSFCYETERPVLENFNLNIKAGERVALVGASGGGKTTIIKLLLRFHRPQAGMILIDGQNIDELRTTELMSCYSLVPQETFLFHRSLRENLLFGASGTVTDEQLSKVVRDSYLEDVIKLMPAGLEQIVGERGVKLSGGERQRIAIARAMLKPAPILILDEATNSLDASSEYHVQLALENLMRGRTSIIIAHKLSTISGVDRILVMRAGKIVEEGRHQELLNLQGEYYKLWRDQEK